MPSPRPTICQILITLGIGGAEVLASRLAYQLQERYRFVFACLDEVNLLGEELQTRGFRVQHIGRRSGLDLGCAVRIARFCREEGVQLMHAHQYTPFFYSAVARRLYRRPPVLFVEHGRAFPDGPRRRRMVANRLLLERRDRVVGVGEGVRRALVDNEGFLAERVGVIHNGVDLAPYDRPSHDRAAVRSELGVEAGDLVIMQVARLDRLKDHSTALRAMARVVDQYPTARLLLVGLGDRRQAIEEEIASRGLGAHVRLLGARRDVPRLLAAADLFLLTSITEGIPLTVIEAMAAGLAVVATRVGGVGEVVVDGTTGYLASAQDSDELARHILRFAEEPARRSQFGRDGRTRAFDLFSEVRMHEQYVSLYDRMLSAS